MTPTLLHVNGADLLCIRTDRFKGEHFSLRLVLPLEKSTVQQNSLLTSVLGCGTVGYPTKLLLNRRLDELYSTGISARNQRLGDMQTIGFSCDLLGARYTNGKAGILPDVLDMLAELCYRPLLSDGAFCADYLENEKENLRDGIRAAINNPRSYAMSKCRKMLCAGEPFALSLIGEEETLGAITPQVLTERYRAAFEASTPSFFYVGATPPEEVARMVSHSFPSFDGYKHSYRATVRKWEGESVSGVEEMPLCQGKLSIGFRTDVCLGHPLAPATVLLNEIFGATPASKLFLNVREKRSLCYHCSSTLDLYKGVMFANAGMTPENRAITEEAMLAEFAAIADGDITDTEFEAAHRSLAHAYRQVYDNPAALASFYAGRAVIGNSDSVEMFRQAVSRVTKEQVVEAAAHMTKGATFFLKGTLSDEEGEE